MEFPTQMVCSECGRNLKPGDELGAGFATDCPECGGLDTAFPSDGPNSSAPSHTPTSLELTPEDLSLGAWTEPTSPSVPHALGRFRLAELLGGGGFGQVHRAHDSRLDRDVALKILRDPRPPARVIERFFREARAAAQLDHPNIVAIHDAGRDDGRCWIAYQYIKGETLAHHRDENRYSPREAVNIVRELAEALDHAHRRGVYHRDVKPANVIVDLEGRPRLTDFGLARRVDFDPTMTQDGAILGTPAYMSPEQAEGKSHTADARSDLYSLGVMLFELLRGRRANESPRPSGTAHFRFFLSQVPELTCPEGLDRLGHGLGRICRRVLAKNPDHRYDDARAFADDLDRWLQSHDKRHVPIKQAAVLAAVGLAAFFAGAWRSRPAGPPAKAPEIASSVSRIVIKSVKAGGETPPGKFVIARGMNFFHRRECVAVPRLAEEDRIALSMADIASNPNFKPCLICRPLDSTKSEAIPKPTATATEAVEAGKIVTTARGEGYHWARCATVANHLEAAKFKQYDTVALAKADHHTKPCQQCEKIRPSEADRP